VSIVGLAQLTEDCPVSVVLHHEDGSEDRIETRHTLNEDQIVWFRAGSALNVLCT
jgi:aconitate hydratase